MALVQLLGYVAFIVASFVLGVRLLLLWRHTREVPELIVGLSFLIGGGFGFMAWLVMGAMLGSGSEIADIKPVVIVGLACSVLGTLCNAWGTMLIFRRSALWAKLLALGLGSALVTCWCVYAVASAEASMPAFWRTMLLSVPVYTWAAVEGFLLTGTLRKRARLGLASPLVAHRTLMYACCSVAAVTSIAVTYAAFLAYGADAQPWTATLAASCLLAGALAIWLGFFPPTGLRARIERTQGAD